MRFLSMIKSLETQGPPPPNLIEAIGRHAEQAARAGTLVETGGLAPTAQGARVRVRGGALSVIDGPFPETKEVVGGYAVLDLKSKEEAIEATRAFMQLHIDHWPEWEGEAEVREVVGGSAAAPPQTKIFVNLPVRDLKRSVEFFTRLGYRFDARFTNENATCMIVADQIYVMLLVEAYFRTFTPKPIADARSTTETLVALSAASRDDVNRIVETALAAGARRYAEPKDHGFMYQWGFEDLDGHIWEHFWMDPAGIPAPD